MNLILASKSSYRKDLLKRLGLHFVSYPPVVDEENLKNNLLMQKLSPVILAETLSFEKGQSVLSQLTGEFNVIISGDQLVSFENQILGKPLTVDNAINQLQLLNNKNHRLITAVTLFIKDKVIKYNHTTELKMKNLSTKEIINYVHKDLPLDCAGSYKIELHGITLFESIKCDDFTAIQGIPIIWLSNQLKEIGYEFFKN